MRSLIIASLFLAGCSAQVGESPKANIFTGVVPIIGVEFMGAVVGIGYVGKRDSTAEPFADQPEAIRLEELPPIAK